VSPDKAARWRFARRALAIFLAILAAAYFARQIVSHWPSIVSVSFTPGAGIALAAATLLNVLAGVINAWSWGWLLRGLSTPLGRREVLGIFLVSQFAKYIPGNVAQHVGRIALARSHGLPYSTVVLSMIIETGFALGAGAVVAGASIVFGATAATGGAARAAWVIALIAFGWLCGAILLRVLLPRPLVWKRLLRLEKPVMLDTSLILGYLSLHVLSYLFLGANLVLIVTGLMGPSEELFHVGLAGMAGWFAAYFVPGAPAGLGVREAALTALLTPLCGPTVAVSAALLSRVSALFGDGILFLIGLGLRPSKAPEALD
jgi:uncharacterized membrane protein YbhN (UPF0104 family)